MSIAGDPRAVQLQEHADPLARLRRHLRRLGRGGERGDHVELAPPGDLRAARDVDRAQLDRRPRERPHDGAGVGGIGEQPQPGEHVADLGALEERRLADQPVGHGALLERDRHRLALARDRGDEHRDRPRVDALARDQALDVGRHRLRLRALVGAAPELDLAAGGSPGARRPPSAQAAGREHALGTAQAALEPIDRPRPRRGSRAARLRRRGSAAAPGPGSPATVRPSPPRPTASRAAARLSSWASSTSTCCEPPRAVGPDAQRARQQVAGVAGARLGEHPLVRAVHLGELAPRIGSASAAAHAAYCSTPISSALSRSILRTKPPSSALALPPKSWCCSDSSSIRSSSIASRSPGPSSGPERVLAGVVEHRRRELDRRQDEQLLVAALERLLEPLAHRIGTGRRRGQERDPLRRAPLLDEPAKARPRARASCRSRPRRARAVGHRVGDSLALSGKQSHQA